MTTNNDEPAWIIIASILSMLAFLPLILYVANELSKRGPSLLCKIHLHNYKQFSIQKPGHVPTLSPRCCRCGKYYWKSDDPDQQQSYIKTQTHNYSFEDWQQMNHTKYNPLVMAVYKVGRAMQKNPATRWPE